MSIWFNKNIIVDDLHSLRQNTLVSYLEMEWVAIGDDFLQIKMPVNDKTKQPYGLLHGGASCALAETAGSVASSLVIDPQKSACVGIEINANHIRGARDGFVIATASPLHLGRTTHVWDIKIHDEAGKLICISRLTVAITDRKQFIPQ
jgi:1,4-dihydroxy-2-naphthoyl-CoA hydrolase